MLCGNTTGTNSGDMQCLIFRASFPDRAAGTAENQVFCRKFPRNLCEGS